jgi:hypothetical protein
MFAAVVLVCGLNVPTAVDGCGLSWAPMPFRTHEECMESLRLNGIPSITERLPKSGFIADAKCIRLDHAA